MIFKMGRKLCRARLKDGSHFLNTQEANNSSTPSKGPVQVLIQRNETTALLAFFHMNSDRTEIVVDRKYDLLLFVI